MKFLLILLLTCSCHHENREASMGNEKIPITHYNRIRLDDLIANSMLQHINSASFSVHGMGYFQTISKETAQSILLEYNETITDKRENTDIKQLRGFKSLAHRHFLKLGLTDADGFAMGIAYFRPSNNTNRRSLLFLVDPNFRIHFLHPFLGHEVHLGAYDRKSIRLIEL